MKKVKITVTVTLDHDELDKELAFKDIKLAAKLALENLDDEIFDVLQITDVKIVD